MSEKPDEICTRPQSVRVFPEPSTLPIYPAAVYECQSTGQADQLLGGEIEGFVYQRDGHPNATVLGEMCRRLHGGDGSAVAFGQVTSTGMSALALALAAVLETGQHVVISHQMYGRSTRLVVEEFGRWGLSCTEVDMTDLDAIRAAMTSSTRMLMVETIANPLLDVVDLPAIAEIARQNKATFLVDNTFATPMLTRPLDLGADLVMESMSKILNGHGDLMMGLLCGREQYRDRVRDGVSSWGMTASPFDCWLATRGIATAHLRVERACENAMQLANWLAGQPGVQQVHYPGLASHPTHQNACRILGGRLFGNMISLELRGGREAADRFISNLQRVRFCPSLGEIATTISHPRSTSHRGLKPEKAREMGITDGLIRVSCGIESFDTIGEDFENAFSAMD